MNDPLTEYRDRIRDLGERFAVTPGWFIAALKEDELVPGKADRVAIVFTASAASIYWATSDEPEWTLVT